MSSHAVVLPSFGHDSALQKARRTGSYMALPCLQLLFQKKVPQQIGCSVKALQKHACRVLQVPVVRRHIRGFGARPKFARRRCTQGQVLGIETLRVVLRVSDNWFCTCPFLVDVVQYCRDDQILHSRFAVPLVASDSREIQFNIFNGGKSCYCAGKCLLVSSWLAFVSMGVFGTSAQQGSRKSPARDRAFASANCGRSSKAIQQLREHWPFSLTALTACGGNVSMLHAKSLKTTLWTAGLGYWEFSR